MAANIDIENNKLHCRMIAEYNRVSHSNELVQEIWLVGLLEENPEPVLCSYFGCGARLTLVEKLCGKYCCNHSRVKSKTDAADFISY